MIAYLGAMRHDADALGWYARAGDLSDLQLAWKTRAALRDEELEGGARRDRRHDRGGKLGSCMALLEGAGAEGARAWRRRRRASEAARGPSSTSTASSRSKILAASISVPATVWKPGPEDIRAMSQTPGIRRALELYRLNLRVEGNREWLYAIRVARRPAAHHRRRARAPQRPVRPRDQHRRPDRGAARFQPALPRAVPRRAEGADRAAESRRSVGLRPDTPGKPLHREREIERGGERPDAAHAGDRAVGRDRSSGSRTGAGRT